MRTLLVEDDATSRLLLQCLLSPYGPLDVAENGREAIEAVTTALRLNTPYDLICLDIMMPEMDGHVALEEIRILEDRHCPEGRGARVLMTTAMHDRESISKAFRGQCDGYLIKPIARAKLVAYLRELELIER